MKNEQQQQAKHLYFQSGLNKSQIADTLGVNRRTVMLWVQQGNWDRLKMSAQHLPAMVTEKCYYVLDHYLTNLLAANGAISTFGTKEASAINQLATAIKKVRTRSAVNESMEMMSFFLDDVRRKDPTMAEAIMPFIEQYIAKRKDTNLADFLPANFNDQGFVNEPTDDIMEQWLDEQEHAKMEEEAATAAGVVIPKEEEVLIKSFRDNCEETRVMRPIKDSSGAVPSTNTSGNTSKY
jgi:DNA-directed RNA polymerase specialized sigma54-like protein